MKKQFTTAIAVALIALAGSSFALASSLEFDSLADADILAGGADFSADVTTTAITFDAIADADLLAGADRWDALSSESGISVAFNPIADADILTLQACNYAGPSAK